MACGLDAVGSRDRARWSRAIARPAAVDLYRCVSSMSVAIVRARPAACSVRTLACRTGPGSVISGWPGTGVPKAVSASADCQPAARCRALGAVAVELHAAVPKGPGPSHQPHMVSSMGIAPSTSVGEGRPRLPGACTCRCPAASPAPASPSLTQRRLGRLVRRGGGRFDASAGPVPGRGSRPSARRPSLSSPVASAMALARSTSSASIAPPRGRRRSIANPAAIKEPDRGQPGDQLRHEQGRAPRSTTWPRSIGRNEPNAIRAFGDGPGSIYPGTSPRFWNYSSSRTSARGSCATCRSPARTVPRRSASRPGRRLRADRPDRPATSEHGVDQ